MKVPTGRIDPGRFSACCKARGLSERELGKRIGVSHTQVHRWSTADTTPDGWNLLKLARELRVTPEYLFGSEEDRESVMNDVRLRLGEVESDVLELMGSLSETDRSRLRDMVRGFVQHAKVARPLTPFEVERAATRHASPGRRPRSKARQAETDGTDPPAAPAPARHR